MVNLSIIFFISELPSLSSAVCNFVLLESRCLYWQLPPFIGQGTVFHYYENVTWEVMISQKHKTLNKPHNTALMKSVNVMYAFQ